MEANSALRTTGEVSYTRLACFGFEFPKDMYVIWSENAVRVTNIKAVRGVVLSTANCRCLAADA